MLAYTAARPNIIKAMGAKSDSPVLGEGDLLYVVELTVEMIVDDVAATDEEVAKEVETTFVVTTGLLVDAELETTGDVLTDVDTEL